MCQGEGLSSITEFTMSPIILFAGLLLGPGPEAEDNVKAHLRRLEGTWAVIAHEYQGAHVGTDELIPELVRQKLHVKDGRLTLTLAGDTIVAPHGAPTKPGGPYFRLNPGETTHTFDLIFCESTNNLFNFDSRVEGIYELTGDRLRICVALGHATRPRDFTTERGAERVLL